MMPKGGSCAQRSVLVQHDSRNKRSTLLGDISVPCLEEVWHTSYSRAHTRVDTKGPEIYAYTSGPRRRPAQFRSRTIHNARLPNSTARPCGLRLAPPRRLPPDHMCRQRSSRDSRAGCDNARASTCNRLCASGTRQLGRRCGSCAGARTMGICSVLETVCAIAVGDWS